MKNLNVLFGFHLVSGIINPLKSRAASYYEETYNRLINKICKGGLIHADETKANVQGKSAYVWVITNMEEVAYIYTETREANFIHELLHEFNGVLVSDFYAAYDSLACRQQKCLIHLIRDLNNDLLRYPFDQELRNLVMDFIKLIKPMIDTVDKYGLKTRYLRKHNIFIERFFKNISKHEYSSEHAIKYSIRFIKNRNKLFTFLDFDNIPWNNNNAEHAIKAFSKLRNIIRGSSTEKGTREYLVLLSISETCKFKGLSFLDFLRSGQKDIDTFAVSCLKRRKML